MTIRSSRATLAIMRALACIVLDDPVHYERICYNHRAPLVDGMCPVALSAAKAALSTVDESQTEEPAL